MSATVWSDSFLILIPPGHMYHSLGYALLVVGVKARRRRYTLLCRFAEIAQLSFIARHTAWCREHALQGTCLAGKGADVGRGTDVAGVRKSAAYFRVWLFCQITVWQSPALLTALDAVWCGPLDGLHGRAYGESIARLTDYHRVMVMLLSIVRVYMGPVLVTAAGCCRIHGYSPVCLETSLPFWIRKTRKAGHRVLV